MGLTDPEEARRMLEERLAEFRSMSYVELRAMAEGSARWSLFGGRVRVGRDPGPEDRFAPSGRLYQFEFFAVVESETDVHVFVELLEERNVHRTLTEDFIMRPDGSFVGEDAA